MRVEVDTRQFEKLQNDLEDFAEKGLPHASRNATNRTAFAAREEWIAEAKGAMTLRGSFVPRSIQVERARGTRFPMFAVVGSTAAMMGELERGGRFTPRGSGHYPIPTVSGARRGAVTNKIPKPNRLSSIDLRDKPGGSRKQRNAIAIRRAIKAKSRFALIETAKGQGIAKVTGRGKQLTVRLIWDLSRSSVQVPPRPTLERTLQKLEPRAERIYIAALVEQLHRNKVMGY